jgi:hypothetical protein
VYGEATLEALAKAGSYRLLPPKPGSGESAEAVARASKLVGGVNVGLLGVSTFAPVGTEIDPQRERALMAAAQKEADALEASGARFIVMLVSGSQRLGRRLAGGVKNVDLVVLGGLESAEVLPPSRVGDAYVLRAGQQGQNFVVADVFASGDVRFGADADGSEWTRREASKDARARVDELAARVSTWKSDPNVDKTNLAEQELRLAQLRAELAKLEAKADVQGAHFAARAVEMGPEIAGDPEVRAMISAYDARVNEHNKVAFADVKPKPAPQGTASYVGSERCKSCHASQFAWWTGHPHGHAYTTLQTRHKEFNLSCVACHVTGYAQPGGSTIVHNAGLTHVGCESCHGAGSKHVDNPDEEPAIGMTRDPSADTCKHCHSPEHSDKFEFAAYRAKLIVPGHGLPKTDTAVKAAP